MARGNYIRDVTNRGRGMYNYRYNGRMSYTYGYQRPRNGFKFPINNLRRTAILNNYNKNRSGRKNIHPMVKKRIMELIDMNKLQIVNGGVTGTYITYPALGTNNNQRGRDYIKLLQLDYKIHYWTRAIKADEMNDDLISLPGTTQGTHGLHGCLSMLFVLAKKPLTEDVPVFSDIFEAGNGMNCDCRIIQERRCDYVLLKQEKRNINSVSLELIAGFNGIIYLSPSFSRWAAFKDIDESTSGGNYQNIIKNCILVYFMWDSPGTSVVNFGCNFELQYIG